MLKGNLVTGSRFCYTDLIRVGSRTIVFMLGQPLPVFLELVRRTIEDFISGGCPSGEAKVVQRPRVPAPFISFPFMKPYFRFLFPTFSI